MANVKPLTWTETPASEYPLVDRSQHPGGSTVLMGDVAFGGDAFVVIAGPCAVESREQMDASATLVTKFGARVLRGGAFKPRTSPYSFQGMGFEGIELLQAVSRQHGMPFVTEVMSISQVKELEPHVDGFQVGTRNMHNFDLLRALGATKKPVLLKRGFGATLREWLLACEYVAQGGNSQIILCERGIRSFTPETRFTLDLAGAIWAKQETHLPVVIDPSHATGLPKLVGPLVAAAAAAGLDGAMIELHPTPDEALSDGDQALTPEQFEVMMSTLRPVVEAVGRTL